MIAAAAMAMLVVAGTVPGASLDIASVDASAYPEVVIDFVLPEQFAAVEVTREMVDVDGQPVAAVTPVDPADVVVSLVIDDRPVVPVPIVGESQGGAVEFVRNIDAGTRIAVGTPSGLQTALTADPGATIARIAGITAGAPAVTRLPQLILDSATALAADDSTDRHLVVALGGPVAASKSQLAQLAELVSEIRISLHIVSPADAPEPALVLIAEQSGGVVPASGDALAAFDMVTDAISNRYRITTTLTAPGEHRVGLTIDGTPITAVIEVEAPARPAVEPAPVAAPSTTVASTTVAAAGPVPTTVVDDDAVDEAVDADVGAGATAPSDDERESSFGIIAIVLALVVAGFVGVWFVLHWRLFLKSASTAEVTGEPLLVARSKPKAASASDTAVVPEPATAAEPEPEPVIEPESKPTVEATPELDTAPEPEPVVKAAPESEPAAETKPKPKAKTRSKPKLEPEPEVAPEPEPVHAEEPEPQAEPVRAEQPGPTRAMPRTRMVPSSSSAVGRRRPPRTVPPWPGRRPERRTTEQAVVSDHEPTEAPEWIIAGRLQFNPSTGEVWAGNHEVHLSRSELGILELLMTGGRHGVTEEDIIEAGHLGPDGREVASTLTRLRRKTGIYPRRIR